MKAEKFSDIIFTENKAYLIDTPGYGYHAKNFTKSSEFDEMMQSLLINNT